MNKAEKIYQKIVKKNNSNSIFFSYANKLVLMRKHNASFLAGYTPKPHLEALAPQDQFAISMVGAIAKDLGIECSQSELAKLVAEVFELGKSQNWSGIKKADFTPDNPLPDDEKTKSVVGRYAENLATLRATYRSEVADKKRAKKRKVTDYNPALEIE